MEIRKLETEEKQNTKKLYEEVFSEEYCEMECE